MSTWSAEESRVQFFLTAHAPRQKLNREAAGRLPVREGRRHLELVIPRRRIGSYIPNESEATVEVCHFVFRKNVPNKGGVMIPDIDTLHSHSQLSVSDSQTIVSPVFHAIQ